MKIDKKNLESILNRDYSLISDNLSEVSKKITDFISELFYTYTFSTTKIINDDYNLTAHQILSVDFFYDFQNKKIECQIEQKDIEETHIKKIINSKLDFYEFLVIFEIKEEGYFFSRRSGSIRLEHNDSAHPLLKELINSAMKKSQQNWSQQSSCIVQ